MMSSVRWHVVVEFHSLGSTDRRNVVLRLPSQGVMFTMFVLRKTTWGAKGAY